MTTWLTLAISGLLLLAAAPVQAQPTLASQLDAPAPRDAPPSPLDHELPARRGLRAGGWTLMGLGAAGLSLGIAGTIFVASDSCWGGCDRDYTLSAAWLIASVATVALGISLLVIRGALRAADRAHALAALTPTSDGRGAMIGLGGDF